MKLFGNSRKSKHYGKGLEAQRAGSGGSKKVKKKKRTGLKVLLVLLIILFTLAAAALALGKFWIQPPDIGNNDIDSTEPIVSGRTTGEYTFAVFGMDDGNGNTDTIMVGTFDTENYKINVVSIPRDTLVNVSWNTKKVNTLYANLGREGAVNELSSILGYSPDFYVFIDLNAFETLIDAIGGIYYDVPVDMDYEDPAQDLYIHLKAGPQQLTGEEAMGVVRYRKGYAMADIGRIDTQQDFMMTVAKQLLENKDKIDLRSLVDIFVNDVKTDLNNGEILWFAQEFCKMDSENISFVKIPADYSDKIYTGGHWVSYVTIYVEEWLQMINDDLNPYVAPMEIEDLSILTRDKDTKAIYSTDGVYKGNESWGNDGPNPVNTQTPTNETSTQSGEAGATTSTTANPA